MRVLETNELSVLHISRSIRSIQSLVIDETGASAVLILVVEPQYYSNTPGDNCQRGVGDYWLKI